MSPGTVKRGAHTQVGLDSTEEPTLGSVLFSIPTESDGLMSQQNAGMEEKGPPRTKGGPEVSQEATLGQGQDEDDAHGARGGGSPR